ncbi:MAG TPA: NAD(P)/FAD-dependent oxidoreductase [Microlunatus sp.]
MELADVVVVGAGAAGLSCARALTDAGMSAVVLEARARIGGRVLSHRSSDGTVIELGAQLVHPTTDPAADALITAPGLRSAPLPPADDVLVIADGRRWDSAALVGAGLTPPWVVDHRLVSVSPGGCPGPGTTEGLSVAAALSGTAALSGLSADDAQLAGWWLEQSVGESPSRVDLDGLLRSRSARVGPERVLIDGIDSVLTSLAGGLDIRLDAPVRQLRWRAGRVTVLGRHPLAAAATVVTVPPAVVADQGIVFDPELPAEKTTALSALASCDAVVVHCVTRAPASRSCWALLAEPPWGLWRTVAGERYVVGHVKGDRAALARRASWTTENTGWLARQLDPGLAEVVEVTVRDWGADPWSRGAYTVPRAGVDLASASWAEELAETVHFAGEATAPAATRGLLQGALASGGRAADEVLRALAHR